MLSKEQREIIQKSTLNQIREICKEENYSRYNYDHIITAIKYRIELSEGMLK